jgi:hypothetical protein
VFNEKGAAHWKYNIKRNGSKWRQCNTVCLISINIIDGTNIIYISLMVYLVVEIYVMHLLLLNAMYLVIDIYLLVG